MKKIIKNILFHLKSLSVKKSGIVRKNCSVCGSNQIKYSKKCWLSLPYDIPDCFFKYRDQLHIRNNGICLSCGLEQSFYIFTDEARLLLSSLGLETLSDSDGFVKFPPDKDFMSLNFNKYYKKRFPKWMDKLNDLNFNNIKDLLFIRPYYGEVLNLFNENFNCNIYYRDVIGNCNKYIFDNFNEYNLYDADIFSNLHINEKHKSLKFDLVVCFHTLTHSVNLGHDLKTLTSLLKPNGILLVCDDISKKYHNPFHITHFDEATFISTMSNYFSEYYRIDDCGEKVDHITNYTIKSDNPDYLFRI